MNSSCWSSRFRTTYWYNGPSLQCHGFRVIHTFLIANKQPQILFPDIQLATVTLRFKTHIPSLLVHDTVNLPKTLMHIVRRELCTVLYFVLDFNALFLGF